MSIKEIMEKERRATVEAMNKGNFDAFNEAEVFDENTIYHVKNGKIVEFIEHSDYLGFFQQIGVIQSF